MWLWPVAAACFVYLSFAVWMWWMQDRLVYVPQREVLNTPDEVGLAYRDIRFPSADGTPLHGWYVPGMHPDAPMLLFCHGNAGNVGHRLESLRRFHSMGMGVFVFDYRGYGNSGGSPSEAGLYQDALAAYDILKNELHVPTDRIFALGRSLGGPVAAHVAARRPMAGLILEATFTDMRDLGEHMYPWLPVRSLSRNYFPTREFLSQSDIPVLIFHSVQDERVPIGHGRVLHEVAGSRSELIPLIGRHNDAHLVSHGRYAQSLMDFVSVNTKPGATPPRSTFQ